MVEFKKKKIERIYDRNSIYFTFIITEKLCVKKLISLNVMIIEFETFHFYCLFIYTIYLS